jgi:hypothetical protein
MNAASPPAAAVFCLALLGAECIWTPQQAPPTEPLRLAAGVSDRIAVLRRGVQIGIRDTRRTSANEIVSMITGLQAADATSDC